MVNIWRCEICGESYIGNEVPAQCPFCGVNRRFIKAAKMAKPSFDTILIESDLANARRALELEISNAGFYFCASRSTDEDEGRAMFKALSKVEAEHVSIWKKILKIDRVDVKAETCFKRNAENLMASYDRETRAIEFYRKAGQETTNQRLKQIFLALVEVETDHLSLSAQRM